MHLYAGILAAGVEDVAFRVDGYLQDGAGPRQEAVEVGGQRWQVRGPATRQVFLQHPTHIESQCATAKYDTAPISFI